MPTQLDAAGDMAGEDVDRGIAAHRLCDQHFRVGGVGGVQTGRAGVRHRHRDRVADGAGAYGLAGTNARAADQRVGAGAAQSFGMAGTSNREGVSGPL